MKFSIVIPVFNSAPFILRCMNSLIVQSFKDFEVIIINDGSTDDSLNLIENFKLLHHHLNLSIVSQANKGRSSARNIGIAKSRGEFVCFLDADDEFKPNHLYFFNTAIEKNPHIDCFFADSEVVREDDLWNKYDGYLARLLQRGVYWEKKENYVYFDQNFPRMLVKGSLIPMCSTAIRKKVFIQDKCFNENFSIAEDFELWFRLSFKYKFLAIDEKLSTVHHHQDNSIHPSNQYVTVKKQLDVTQHILNNYQITDSTITKALILKKNNHACDIIFHASKQSLRGVLLAYIKLKNYSFSLFIFFIIVTVKTTIKYLFRAFL